MRSVKKSIKVDVTVILTTALPVSYRIISKKFLSDSIFFYPCCRVFPSSLDLSVVSLLLFTKHIALLYSYLSICFLGVYSVISGFKNSTEHDQEQY